MNIFGESKVKIYIFFLAIITLVAAGGIFALRYFSERTPGISVKTGCDWRPTEDYGLCERILGAYYNGEKCVWLSGCSAEGEIIPFKLIEDCRAQCEK